jgi:hypothetical protein
MLALSALPTESRTGAEGEVMSARPEKRNEDDIAADWQATRPDGAEYRPAGVTEPETTEQAAGGRLLTVEEERLLAALQKRLNLGIALVLGVCVLGGLMIVLVLRRESARLEARMKRFEHVAKQNGHDWLANLDDALEGEWEEQQR